MNDNVSTLFWNCVDQLFFLFIGRKPTTWPANIIICVSLRLRQISDLLATGKSRYFAQPRPIIVNCVSEYRDCEQSLFCSKITFLYSPYMAVPPTPAGVYLYFALVINEVKSIFASLERKNETFVLRPEIKITVNAKFRALNANIKSRIFCTHRQNKSSSINSKCISKRFYFTF